MPEPVTKTVSIRLAQPADLPAINDIYNYYVLHSTCTYQLEPETPQDRVDWFNSHDANHPVTVAKIDGQIVGWGALSKFRTRAAYDQTVENSVYVRHDQLHKGIGAAILKDLIERGRHLGYHTIIAGISAEQEASVALHRKFQFTDAALLREVGRKHGLWLDVVYMQLML